MNIGSLNRRIELQYSTKTPDGMGGFKTIWTVDAVVWSAIWPTSATEIIAANAISMVVTHRIRIRHRSILKSSWRIKFGDRYFNIVSIINPNMSNRYLDIMAKEAA